MATTKLSTANIYKSGYDPFAPPKIGWLDTGYQQFQDQVYDPTMKTYLDQATKGIDVEARKNAAGAEVAHSFANEEAKWRQNMSRFGIDPTSGMYQSGLRNLALSRATGTAGARTAAAERARAEEFTRLSDAAGKISPLMQAYLSTRGQVGLGLREGQMTTFADMYGSEKRLAGDQARASATRYAADQSLAGARYAADQALARTQAAAAAQEHIAAMNNAERARELTYQSQQRAAYNAELQALQAQEQQALQQYQSQNYSSSHYWGTILGAAAGGVGDAAINWLFSADDRH